MKSTKLLLLAVFVLILVSVNPSTASVPTAEFFGTPTTGSVPLSLTFTDQSTGSPTGWAWFFGDETYTAQWTEMTAMAEWATRYHHTSVVMPDGSIVLMGGSVDDFRNDTWHSTNNGTTWTLMNASSGWTARSGHSSVVMPDGSIVLMGGRDTGNYRNDVWRSTDYGATWMLVNASAWSWGRFEHSSVMMPDGSIVVMGGYDGGWARNDVSRSTDNGVTWTQMKPDDTTGWTARSGHSSVVMPDGSIVLMGGYGGGPVKNDTWRSTNNGTSWTQINASSGWAGRLGHSSVVMPDGSIVLMGGQIEGHDAEMNPLYKNDLWRSTNDGATWTLVTASVEWAGRLGHTSVVMPDGSIVLMGGQGLVGFNGLKNDVWRFMPAGSSAKNPSHTYTAPGVYNVSLQSYKTTGYNSTRKMGYITATLPVAPKASFTSSATNGTSPLAVTFTDTSTNTPTAWNWSFKNVIGNNTQVWFSTSQNPAHIFGFGNYSIVLNASNSAGHDISTQVWFINVTSPTVHTPNTIYFISIPTGADVYINNSFQGPTPYTVGDAPNGNYQILLKYPGYYDWSQNITVNNNVQTVYAILTKIPSKTGVYRPGVGFYLKMDNGSTWTPSTDKYLAWDNAAGDLPIAGDWNGDGRSETGVYRPGVGFYLNRGNGNTWDPWWDVYLAWDNAPGDLPIAGDWNADGQAETGVYRPGVGFYLKMDDYSTWNPSTDQYLAWDNAAGDLPIAGDWNSDGRTETGVYRPGVGFYLKMDNSSSWNPSTDKYLAWDNAAIDRPVAGDWNMDGRTETGVYRPGAGFYLKMDNGSTWNPSTDKYLAWDNAAMDLPIAGNFV